MTSKPSYMAVVGAAVPTILARRWQGIANSVRWTTSISVDDLRSFMAGLPGVPVPLTGEQLLARFRVLSDDGDDSVVILVPVELRGSDLGWGLTLNLNGWRPVRDPDDVNWLWGLGEQRMLSAEEMTECLRSGA